MPSFFATGFSVCTQTPRPRRLAARGIQIDFGDGAGHFTQNSYALTIPGTDFNDNANILPGDFDGDGDIDLLSGRIVRRATVGANQAITINEHDELSFADGFESAGP